MEKNRSDNDLILMRNVYSALILLAKDLEKHDTRNREGLTLRQYMTIRAADSLPEGDNSMVNIARIIGTSKQNVTRLIPVLEKKGFVTREVFDNPRRGVNITVTDSGHNAIDDYADIGKRYITDIFYDFNEEELKDLLRLLRKFNYNDGQNYAGYRDAAAGTL